MSTFFTADEHHFHANIIKFCDRPFDDKAEMSEKIIENHNSLVKEGDTVWHLGDFSYRGDWHDVVTILRRMNGKHMFIFGNHDQSLMNIARQGRSNDMIRSGHIRFYGPPEKGQSLNMMVNVNNQQIHISHYAQRTWLAAFRGGWHLFGHSHTNLPPFYKSMDVGIDNNNYFPFHFDEIKYFMDGVSQEFTEEDQ